MPIVDVEIVCTAGRPVSVSTQALADELGRVFGSEPGRTWVRVRALPRESYAENASVLDERELPAFVTVLHARPPVGEALTAEAQAVTAATARVLQCPPEFVHVQYAPAGIGRVAFGGKLVS